MKPTKSNRFVSLTSVIALGLAANASAADLYWDANGATTTATGGTGTWSTANTWRDGSATGTLGNWSDGNTAVFGGSAGTVTVSSAVSVNQMKVSTASYTIGAAGAGPISFGGAYNDATPAIDTTGIVAGVRTTTINAKITGTINGGLVIKDSNNITTPLTGSRVVLAATSTSDFVGNITILSGNLNAPSNLGDAGNDIILKGGALYLTGTAAATTTIARDIDVAATSGIGTSATGSGLQLLNLSGNVTGASNLTRYSHIAAATTISEVQFSGDLSGYSGIVENAAPTLGTGGVPGNVLMTIQTTATSGGAWKISGAR